jgi:hypothetical protein
MNAAFEALISHDVDISMHTGSLIVQRGLYIVTGAELVRIEPVT